MDIFQRRRKRFIEAVSHFHHIEQGVIIVPAAFEQGRGRFRQNSSFYYLTGVREPGSVLLLQLDGQSTLYLPDFGGEREKWLSVQVNFGSNPAEFSFEQIKRLGEVQKGYSLEPFFKIDAYRFLLQDLETFRKQGWSIAAVNPRDELCSQQYYLLQSMQEVLYGGAHHFIEVSQILDAQRRIKDADELELIKKAIDITIDAQKRAAQFIRPGVRECEVQAEIEATFTASGALLQAFPSIVATGKNSTVLHYTDNNQMLKKGDLVVVDIGAEFDMYAADLTRTYPVDGEFSARQASVYQLVLDAQAYIASLAKPGMYLRNAQMREQSLHWQTVEFFRRQQGMEKFFPHGIGHYMGLDVHDVGDYGQPLQVGDVFTIEPGLYLPDEAIGVRIEDDYLMTDAGALCLSKALPSAIKAIEVLMQS